MTTSTPEPKKGDTRIAVSTWGDGRKTYTPEYCGYGGMQLGDRGYKETTAWYSLVEYETGVIGIETFGPAIAKKKSPPGSVKACQDLINKYLKQVARGRIVNTEYIKYP